MKEKKNMKKFRRKKNVIQNFNSAVKYATAEHFK